MSPVNIYSYLPLDASDTPCMHRYEKESQSCTTFGRSTLIVLDSQRLCKCVDRYTATHTMLCFKIK